MWFNALSQYSVAPSPAPALTLENVYEAVKGVPQHKYDLLSIYFGAGVLPNSQQYSFDEAFIRDAIQKFLQIKCLTQPSWRRVIRSLDMVDEVDLADKITSFGEPVLGEWTY